MYTDRTPRWIAGARAGDRDVVFDSPRCLFFELRERPRRYRNPWVTEYYSQRRRPAAAVRYVSGSDVIGPMGPDVIPVDPARAEVFLRDHRGRRILTFQAITLTVLRQLDRRP